MTQSRLFVLIFCLATGLTLGSLAVFNYAMDPLWTFALNHEGNDRQEVIDERQQKTNHLFFQPVSADTILLGSSRSTYIDQHAFTGMDVYNYSVSNMSIREYDTFLAFAKRQSDKPIQRAIVGLDFFKSSVQESSEPHALTNYETKLEDPLYRWKNLLSLDTFQYAWRNFQMSRANDITLDRVYNRENVAFAKPITDEERRKQTLAKIKRFKEEFYGDSYTYNPKYKQFLGIFNERHPDVEKIIYTTPISTDLFRALVETGLYPSYEQWLRDVADLYGGVYNFMYPNDVTDDLTNYFDGHHFYPETGTKIAERISAGPEADSSFGVYVTPENIESHFAFVRGELKKRGITVK